MYAVSQNRTINLVSFKTVNKVNNIIEMINIFALELLTINHNYFQQNTGLYFAEILYYEI